MDWSSLKLGAKDPYVIECANRVSIVGIGRLTTDGRTLTHAKRIGGSPSVDLVIDARRPGAVVCRCVIKSACGL